MASEFNPPPSGDREYSVNEMMERLKQGERDKRRQGDDRELITRDDGTQVVKVRKRRRRTQQPKKVAPTLNPKLKWGVLGSLLCLGILIAVSILFVIAKYNGRKFKESTEAKIAELSGAEQSNLSQLRVTPLSATASKYETTWGKHSFLKNAIFNNLNVDINATSFFSSQWNGNEISASHGKAILQKPVHQIEAGSSNLASIYNFSNYRCNQLDLYFGEEAHAPAIKDLQISQRKTSNEKYQFVYQNGITVIPNWPEFKLSSGVIILNSQDIEITTLLEAVNNPIGELSIDGRISTNTNNPIALNVTAKDYPIEELLGAEFGQMIQGTIQSTSGSLSYNYQKPSISGLSFTLPFNSNNITLSNLPFLSTLKDLTGNINYVRSSFRSGQGKISRSAKDIQIRDLNLVSNGMITLKGNIIVNTDKKLHGTLNVGIPTSAFKDTPPKPFIGPTDGLYIANITLSGTIHNPHDNLRELIQANSDKSITPARLPAHEPLPLDPKQKMEQDFDALTR